MSGGFALAGFHGPVLLFGREWRHDAFDEGGGCVLEDAGGIAFLVALDFSAGNVLSIAVDAGEFQCQRIGESHVAVEPPEECGMIAAHIVDELVVGQIGWIPTLMVPEAIA